MLSVPFVGTEEEAQIVAAMRNSRPLESICDEFGCSPDEAIDLYARYLRLRSLSRANPEASRERHEAALDKLERIVDRYSPRAVSGEVASARLVLAALSLHAQLEERYAKAELLQRVQAERTPAADQDKAAGADRSQAEHVSEWYHSVCAAYAAQGRQTPRHIHAAYLAALGAYEAPTADEPNPDEPHSEPPG